MTEKTNQKASLLKEIEEKLSQIVDPETGMDVLRIRLARDIQVDQGNVRITLRPSSQVCPIAFKLGAMIKDAISSVAGVVGLTIEVKNYIRASELESLLNESSSRKGVSNADI